MSFRSSCTNCPYYVPQFYGDEYRLFFPEKNVHSEYSKSRFFLAYKGDEIVGRIAGIVVYPYIQKTGRKVMRFSRFDLIDDEEVARALFKAVEDFAREEGLDEIQGPMGCNDTDGGCGRALTRCPPTPKITATTTIPASWSRTVS